MKTTTEPLFSNGTEFMWWQDRNCCQCHKAVWYNERTGKYPEYKCALQRDIEHQAGGIEEINIRTFNMIHGCAKCPMFQDKANPKPRKAKTKDDNEPSLFTAEDFARGESLVKSDGVNTMPKTDLKRPKSCENHSENAENRPKKAEIVRKPADLSIPTAPMGMIKPLMPMPDFIKDLPVPPEITQMREAAFRQSVHDDIQSRLKAFTFQEHMRITYAPLAISAMAWIYAEKVLQYAAAHRIELLKKLCRATKHVRDEYFRELRKDLKPSHIDQINRETVKIMAMCNNDFLIMNIQCQAELRKMYGNDVEHLAMRADAYTAVILCKVLDEHNARMDAIIRERMGNCNPTPRNPWMVKLRDCMDAFQGSKDLPFGTQITMCKQIVHKNIGNIEWCTD